MAKDSYEVTFEDKVTGEKFTRRTIASSEHQAIKNIKSESVPSSSLVNWKAEKSIR